MSGLSALCALVRWSTQAAAVSVAVVADGQLHYVAADGAGADAIVGTRLPAGRGIAGFAAATGHSLTVRDPKNDQRFARDTAEATGYIPASLQCVPVEGPEGEVVAVLSILDRAESPLGAGVAGVPMERVTEVIGALVAPDADSAVPGSGVWSADRQRAAALLRSVLDDLER